MASTSKTAQQLLDEVNRLVQLEEFPIEGYVQRLASELGGEAVDSLPALEARDAGLRRALAAIDAFAPRAMRVRLDHALAADTSIQRPFRLYLTSAIGSYAGDLELLRRRVAEAAGRVDPRGAAATADLVVDCADRTLALHAALRAEVLGLARALAEVTIPVAFAAARDRRREDAERTRWSAVRRDLELVVANPARLLEGDLAARCKALPQELEPADEPPEPTRGELIELY